MLQLCGEILFMRLRLLTAVAIGMGSCLFTWFLLSRLHQGAADFSWTIRAARYMLAHTNPYDTPLEQYPLTAAVFAVPFLPLSPEWAAALFLGISSGLLAFGLTREGYHRLLVFFAYPYWAAVLTAQWSPLITAGAFFPLLLPAVMAKPQVGLPVFLTHLSKRGILACLVVFLLSLLAMPKWPFLWIRQFGYYQHFIPLLVIPGPLLLLTLFWYRDRKAMLLLLVALMPQRWFFDSLTLWLIPRTRRETLATAACSWGAGIWRWYHFPHTFTQVGRWAVIFIYLPMLLVVLRQKLWPESSPNERLIS